MRGQAWGAVIGVERVKAEFASDPTNQKSAIDNLRAASNFQLAGSWSWQVGWSWVFCGRCIGQGSLRVIDTGVFNKSTRGCGFIFWMAILKLMVKISLCFGHASIQIAAWSNFLMIWGFWSPIRTWSFLFKAAFSVYEIRAEQFSLCLIFPIRTWSFCRIGKCDSTEFEDGNCQ